MIELCDVSKSFDGGRTFAVDNVSLTVERGETVVLLGSSGSGKSTTLKMINRLVEPTTGRVTIDGASVTDASPEQLRRSIGYVFQGIGLFPHLTILENVCIVPELLQQDRRVPPVRLGETMRGMLQASDGPTATRERARELLELVGLEPGAYETRLPHELSGGQQQRVGVARALAADPDVLLMDEPFGALDAVTRNSLQGELRDLRQRLQKTIIFVTHDIFEAVLLGDRVAVMHEGRLEQVASPGDLVNGPATPFVEALIAKARDQVQLLADL